MQQNGQTVSRLQTRKTEALLAYLALYRQHAHPREFLADLLWPEEEPQISRHRLKQALYAIRSVLEPKGISPGSLLIADRMEVRLNKEAVEIDVAEFEELLRSSLRIEDPSERIPLLEQAHGLYRGELLPGYYEDWLISERERLGEAYRNVLSRLMTARAKIKDLAGAIEAARRAMEADPLRESSHYDLMRLYVAAGQPEQALSQYRQLESILAGQLDSAPSQKVKTLAEQLLVERSLTAPSAEQESLPRLEEMSPAPSLPSGIVTFLMTDIEGSTRLWEQSAEAMRRALIRHDALARDIIQRHEGTLVKSRGEGDSLFCVFAQAGQALAAACALQQAIQREAWPEPCSLRVRMALHTGPADLREGDYYGPVVNRCARLRAIGHGGQVLLTAACQALLPETLPERASLQELGVHRLRDLERGELVYQLRHPALVGDFPPLGSLQAYSTNLPVQSSSFIGREREIAAVKQLLGATRLLTLTGSGGCGKTRLALQVAAEVLEAYPDGVWLVKLEALSYPDQVVQAAASALGLREEPGRSLEETVIDYLKSLKTLLVLDNCEHLVEACASLTARLLEMCMHLKIMTTSREALHVAGELVWRVPSLLQPDPQKLPQEEKEIASVLLEYDAIRLFVERARFQRSDFRLDRRNVEAVALVCHRLEGIPLAIELAAARVRAMSVEQIEQRLEDVFRLLAGGSRTAPTRQQTLEAAIEWSYKLLTEPERLLQERLCVFAGSFMLEAAEAACSGESLAEWEILDLLTSLTDKSLVGFEEHQGEPRYRLLETVRQYGWQKLEQERTLDLWRRRHLDYYLIQAEEGKSLDWLETEHDNLQAGLAYCQAQQDAAQEGLRLAACVYPFWNMRGYLSEGRERLKAALTHEGAEQPMQVRAKALLLAGWLAYRQTDYSEARSLMEESLTIYRKLEVKQGIADALSCLGVLAFEQNDLVMARTLEEQSLAIRKEIGNKGSIASSLNNLASMACERGDYNTACSLHEESLAIRRELGDRHGISIALHNLGEIAQLQGDYAEARVLLEDSLAIRRELGDRGGIAAALSNLGVLACEQQEYATARMLHEESLEIRRELGYKSGIAQSLHDLGVVAEKLGDYATARTRYTEGLVIRRETEDKGGLCGSLEGFASLAEEQRQYDRAACLWGAAAALREAIGWPLSPIEKAGQDRQVALARAALGEERFAAAWEQGHKTPTEQAVQFAQEETS